MLFRSSCFVANAGFSFARQSRMFASALQSTESLVVKRLSGPDTGVTALLMNLPKTRNAISRALLGSFEEALQAVANDSATRVIIISSTHVSSFCAGADLKERATMPQEEVPAFVSRARGLMRNLERLPQPVIAAMNGVALGGGLELALSCDLRTAASDTKIGLTETRLAIIPGAGGTQRLPRIVGVPMAKRMIYSAAILSGDEAHKIGLVDACQPLTKGDFLCGVDEQDKSSEWANSSSFHAALSLARPILANGPIAIQAAKAAINEGINHNIDDALEVERKCYARVIPTKDRLEALDAFKNKRKPVFRGE